MVETEKGKTEEKGYTFNEVKNKFLQRLDKVSQRLDRVLNNLEKIGEKIEEPDSSVDLNSIPKTDETPK
ncbi:MAG: hypothetical protein ABIJ05_02785 [Patescibacteria group bacterium]